MIDLTIENAELALLKQLIRLPSMTPDDAGCQSLLASYLVPLGFSIEHLRFDEVQNLWARRGNASPVLVFAGHTDVVPAGPWANWTSSPFEPTVRDGFLYGRGAVDMKGGLAAMVVACARFVKAHPNYQGSIAFLVTSDEEGEAIHGTREVIELLTSRGEKFEYCVLGEPSSRDHVGDTIKVGRRGSLGGTLMIYGKQGHIAYPHLADNPIHNAFSVLSALCNEVWDNGNNQFSPTAFQISNIHAGTGATNVIPGHLEVVFNFRYSPEITADQIKQRMGKMLEKHDVRHDISWSHSGLPFFAHSPDFSRIVSQAIEEVTGLRPVFSTSGGTSDGRFIATTDCSVVELGLCNATIHQVDECVRLTDLKQLVDIYEKLLLNFFLT
jgi:succinyl-diaminopimelate desuccinylase